MNLWLPLLANGIHIDEMSPDFRTVRVRLRHTRLTTNYVGTQFGGSLFAMTDPFWMIMTLRNVGPAYTVWDTAGQIEFLRPARETVYTHFRLEQSDIDDIQAEAAGGSKVLRWFTNDIVTADGSVVARARKQVYVRRKPPRPSGSPDAGD